MLPLPRHLPLVVAAVALAVVAATPVSAQEARKEPADLGMRMAAPRMQVQNSERPQPRSSLSDSVRRVQRETGGRILGAERVPYDGRDINRVKYMDDRGRVRYMDDEAPAARMRGPGGPAQGRQRSPRADNS
ncbi:hypothetical protein [Stenotrophomonas sp. NLF4-10]|uniref:hypothetical protein n=1 Tax=Stenotrophomonas sp. NLF4-10 TaxID=2918754 RepID=UPI001EFB7193|nr:hypothetical protein [Stenotrophomonas sp. NLF4-10]MCG8275426.1 hypothetical protein [Stenotrophomonas sp. NLF4-10]